MRREFGMGMPEMREAPREDLRREFEYRDVDGRLIGRAEVALGAEEKEIPPEKESADAPVRGRVLREFTLRGEKDGRPTSVDVLGLVGAAGTEIIVASGRLQNYDYDDAAKRATVPPLETLTDVGVFLHELGHAEQHREARFDAVGDLYGSEKDLKKEAGLDLDAIRALAAQVREAVPEAADLLTDEHLDELRQIQKERAAKNLEHLQAVGAHVKELNRKEPDPARLKALEDRAASIQKEADDLEGELKETMEALQVNEFIALPTSIMERDATNRALRWARKVRSDAGIDLFARHAAPDDPSIVRDSECERSVVEGSSSGAIERPDVTDIFEDLKRSLKSYGADALRLFHPDRPEDVGITPSVGLPRRRPTGSPEGK